MRVIVVGCGEVGLHVASVLSAEQHDVTVIERDEGRSAVAQAALDALVITANGASPHVLREAGADKADLVLAVTAHDEVNLLAAAAADRLGAQRSVVRLRDGDDLGQDDDFFREVFGLDGVIDPERATAEDIVATLRVAGTVHVEHFTGDRLALAEVALRAGSPLAGTVVADRARVRPHRIVGVLRHGSLRIPAAAERLEVGDHLFLAAATDDVATVVTELAGGGTPLRDVVVLGGGRLGLHLARGLEAEGFEVKLLEADPTRARHCAERLPRSVVIQEETLSKETLVVHGVEGAGAFVACADDDRTNLLAALHAKRLGVGLSLAVVVSEQFVPLVDAVGIDAAFSVRLATSEAVLRYVRTDAVRALHLTISGAEVLDLEADEGSPIVGTPVTGSDRLEDCEVGAILRDGKPLVPSDDERVQAGDRVLLFRLRGGAPDVEHAFRA